MNKVILGESGISVSRFGMGVLNIGRTQLNLSIDEGAEIVKYALDSGINFLDTAQYYETYPYIKKALQDSSHEPIIASKSLDPTYKGMMEAIEEARIALDRDVIDIFKLHEVRYGDFRLSAWEALVDAKAKGMVKAIGVSTHYTDIADEYAENPDCDILFPLINISSLGIRYKDGQGTKEDMVAAIEKAHKNGKGVYAMKIFGGGILTANYMEALNYVASIKGVDSLMVGIGHKEEIDRLIQYDDNSLEDNYQPDIKDKKIYVDSGDCESCGACIEICPNKAISFNSDGIAEVNHDICLTCGYCAPSCPVRAIIMY